MMLALIRRFVICTVALTMSASGQPIPPPPGYDIPVITFSPHRRYGVTVPRLGAFTDPQLPNQIVDLATGRIIGNIPGDAAYLEAIGHEELIPAYWSANDDMFLWQVDGKWGFNAEILTKLENGRILWQVDVLKEIRRAILERTRHAAPEKYARVKEAGKGDGSWWQDGFAIDSVLDSKGGPMTFPLLYHVFLTSNPKQTPSWLLHWPEVDSDMMVKVNQDGTIHVEQFHMENYPNYPR